MKPFDEIAKHADATVGLPVKHERLRLVRAGGVERRDLPGVLGE